MIIFSLRCFKGCEDRYVTPSSEVPVPGRQYVQGYLCSASGISKQSMPDASVTFLTEVIIKKPIDLMPMNEASAAWLRMLLQKGEPK